VDERKEHNTKFLRIEAGKHRPTLETLEKIAAALKVPVVDLIVRRGAH